MNPSPQGTSSNRSESQSSWDQTLTVLGTVTFFLGHGVAFVFHVVIPASLALLGVSGWTTGFQIPLWVNVTIQTLALGLLVGAWVAFLRRDNHCDRTKLRIALGAGLTVISLVVLYHWGTTVLSFAGVF